LDKRAVRHRFDNAAGSYDAAADLQRQVADLLFACLPPLSPSLVMDVGAGTGQGLRRLRQRWPQAEVIAVDFAPRMLAIAGGGICADLESLPIAPGCADVYWSNLAWQWCSPHQAAGEASLVLRQRGLLAVSSLGPATLHELRDAFAGIDSSPHVLRFEPIETLASACAAAGLTDIQVNRRTVRLHHCDLRAALRALKALGANEVGGQRRPGLLGRRAWQTIEARYESHRTAAGLPTSYEVHLCTARKSSS
jgi:malonyl-CoA O-methyltransferase